VDATPSSHPIRLVVTDDLHRSRLTVFFRWLLGLPHILWLALWSTVAFVIAIINWFATLLRRQSPDGLHEFLAGYLRYATQVEAYLLLAGNPYPGFFVGRPSPYPIDLEIAPPAPQDRRKTGFRIVLAAPALLLAGAFLGGPIAWYSARGFGITGAAAMLVWLATLARGRSPRGLRDLIAWSIGYGAQVGGYLFLLTDRYPYAGPEQHVGAISPPDVDERLPALANGDDLRRSRVTVLLRLPLAFPHLVWLAGWSVLAILAAFANWAATLATGRAPRALARFISAYVRYAAHVGAFLLLVGNPFPGFVGKTGSYPVDLRIDPFQRQHRLITAFRLLLAIPAAIVSGAVGGMLVAVALLGWFASLARAEMPQGLQRAGAYAIGYSAQLNAYALVLTDRYPNSCPQAVFERKASTHGPLDSSEPGAFV
jgi:hypothetical protein